MRSFFCLICIFIFTCVFGQGNDWPDAFLIADIDEENVVRPTEFSTEQTLYSKTFSSRNKGFLHFQKGRYTLSQRLVYSLERDDWLGSMNHFSDMSGKATRRTDGFFEYLGLEWMPLTSFHSQADGNVFQTLIDMGPVIHFSPLGIPVKAHGGLSAIAWNKQLPTFKQLVTSNLNDTLGLYGGLDIGKNGHRLGILPLYFNGSIHGRAVEGAREITGHAGLLFAVQMQSGDSLFAFVGDTISDGNDAFLSQGFSEWGGYVNNPRTVENSLHFLTGVKGIQRNGLSPSFHYSFSEYSLRYPSDPKLLNDVRHRTHGLTLAIESNRLFTVDYRGDLFFSWEEDDKLYNEDYIDEGAQRVVDIRDYDVFAAEMNHNVSKKFQNGLGLNYALHLSRYLREYPIFYVSGSDTLQSDDDYDEVVRKHELTFTVLPLKKVNVDLVGKYAQNFLYLLKAKQSDRSYLDRQYEMGVHSLIKPSDELIIEEKITAAVDQREFKFKLNNGRFPEYSRSIYSDFSVNWMISESWTLKGQWTSSYWDNGYWDASVYRDTIIDTLPRKDFYAIQYKSTDQTLLISSELKVNDHFLLVGGCEFRDVYFREFKNGEYLNNDLGAGYYAGPFVRVNVVIPKPAYLGNILTLKGHIRRSIDDIANDFWDVSFNLQAMF